MIKVVFFDIDETLVLHEKAREQAMIDMCRDGALPDEYVKYYRSALKINPKVNKYLKKYSKDRYRLGIISNGYSHYQIMKLTQTKLFHKFASGLMFFSVDSHTKKTLPKIWNQAERAAGVKPHEILMIGNDVVNDAIQPKVRGWEAVII